MTTAPATAPDWPHCAEGASADDPVGCRGIQIITGGHCLTHLPLPDRAVYLGTLTAGSDLDLRGTTIDQPLLNDLRHACTDPTSATPHFGRTDFTHATFTGDTTFDETTFARTARFESTAFTDVTTFNETSFAGNAWFTGAAFADDATFEHTTFAGDASFESVAFTGDTTFSAVAFTGDARFDGSAFTSSAWFGATTFSRSAGFNAVVFSRSAGFGETTFLRAGFNRTTFTGNANFNSATFTRTADFSSATFTSTADFSSATFTGTALFHFATFEGLQHLGPMTCAGLIDFNSARFAGPQTTIEVAAVEVGCERATFGGSVVLRLRHATLHLRRATLSAPVAVQAWPVPFTDADGTVLDESLLAAGGASPAAHLASLDGVDAAHLVLTDIDLSRCQLTGAFHLDQIQIGFGCRFAAPPTGWHRRGIRPARWSRRKVLGSVRSSALSRNRW